MAVQRKYQVFISSTFRDLQEERLEVIQALLELNCIPSGMELFPAATDDQWTLIKRVIDDCDYYLVIVGGRYGSQTPDGISYTQKEYEYAVEQNKPVLGFLHEKPNEIPAGKSELTAEGREKLRAFRELCEKRMCKYWNSPADLGGKVSRGLVNLFNTNPAVGWVRGNNALDESAAKTIVALRAEIDSLKTQLDRVAREPPKGVEALAQGSDPLSIGITIRNRNATYSMGYADNRTMTWDEIFAGLGPSMIQEASDYSIRDLLAKTIVKRWHNTFTIDQQVEVDANDYHKIIVQLRELGLVTLSQGRRGVKDRGTTFWSLTPFGSEYVNRLVAIRKA